MGLLTGPVGPVIGAAKGFFSPPPGLTPGQGLAHGFVSSIPLYQMLGSLFHLATGTLGQWNNPANNPITQAAAAAGQGGPFLPTDSQTNNPPMYASGIGTGPIDALPINSETNNPPMYAGGGGGGGPAGGGGGSGPVSGYPGGLASYAQGTYGGGGGGSLLQYLQALRQH
jgi:hypothetical protein